MQKMQDEFYKPKKKEEELEDGELPSLSRTGSNPKRPVAYWNQDEPALLRNFLLHLRGVSPPLIPATRPTHAIRNASKSIDTDESEETEKDTNPKGGQWNLMEQAVCFAREKEDVTVEDQQSTNGSNQSLDRRYRTDSESRTERITSTIDYTRTTATVPIPKRKKKNRECFIV
jgi:hypothetical protein